MASNRCPIRKRSYSQDTATKTGAKKDNVRFACGVGAVLALSLSTQAVIAQTSPTGGEQAWRFVPQITIRETYTDNVALVRGDAKKSEFVTEVSPGFSISSKGARANFKIDYNINTLFYPRDEDRNTLNHQLRASGEAELLEDWFFLDSRADIRQQAVSAFGPIGSNSSTNNNKQTIRSFVVSPYLRHAFGRQAKAEARYVFNKQNTSGGNSGVAGNDSSSFLLKIDNGPAFLDWGWGAAYSREQINYERSADSTFESLTGNLRYRINPRLFAIGTFGYDRNDYFTVGDNPQGAFWSVGGDWRPGRRTALNFSAGRRYFGTTYSFGANHTTRQTSWDFTYQRNLTTSRSQFDQPIGTSVRQRAENEFRALNPRASDEQVRLAGETAARDFQAQGGDPDSVSGINFQTNTAFVEKKFQGVVSVQLPKTRLSFTAFDSVRDASTVNTVTVFNRSGDFALSNVVKQSGVSGQVTYRLSARNDANLGLDYSRSRLVDINRTDNLSSLNLGISRKLSRTANGSLGYRFNRRDSNFNANDYDENAFFGSLNLTF
jgi:uncharacterized protein (PEP-CTERM system associated)